MIFAWFRVFPPGLEVIASEDDDAPAVTAESILTEAEKVRGWGV